MELKLNNLARLKWMATLLIVPYGIETQLVKLLNVCLNLLIVPYGIETYPASFVGIVRYAFNRTLWN